MLIGLRILQVADGAETREVPVRLFAPEDEGVDWSCRYEIGWPEGVSGRSIHGVDALQALHLAMQVIGAALYTSEHHASGQLRWRTAGSGYGFPAPASFRDRLVGDDRRFDG